MSTATNLAELLDRLETVADAAGMSAHAAREEGMSVAATISEPARGAFADWAEQLGETPSAARFMEYAHRGRRWRGAPTAGLHELLETRPAQAQAYARVLADICQAATTLGSENPRVLGTARAVAAVQLAAVARQNPERSDQAPQPSPAADRDPNPAWDSGSAEPEDQVGEQQAARESGPADPTLTQEFAQRAPAMLRDVFGQLGALQRRQRAQRPPSDPPSGSLLDLDPSVPIGPGAFAGLPGSARPPEPAPHESRPPEGRPGADPASSQEAQGAEPSGAPETGAARADGDQERDRRARGEQAPEAADAPETTDQAEPEPPSLKELLAQLDALTGLQTVKQEIHKQSAILRLESLRASKGLGGVQVTRHLVFVGNPGTGKTTVARLVAGIYRALGLLSKGQLVEVDRNELVAGYLGQTAIKTSEVVASAEGGILFIDEAYALAGDQFGAEAINTLVKEMEDRRADLVVIVAGYPAPMAGFIAENPGLGSRFRTTISFDDYSDAELREIFTEMAATADYDLSPEALERFDELLAAQPRDDSFGNGRFARNCLEAAVGNHAWRLREVDEPTLDQLRTLLPEDLPEDPEPAESGSAPGLSGAEDPADLVDDLDALLASTGMQHLRQPTVEPLQPPGTDPADGSEPQGGAAGS